MDETDRTILRELQLNARKSISEISKKVKLSLPSVSERLRKLESSHAIRQYAAILEPSHFGKDLFCFSFIALKDKAPKSEDDFFRFIKEKQDILECHCITGQYEYMLKIRTKSTASLERLLSELRNMTSAKSTSTLVVLSTAKENPSISPDAL